MYKGQELVQRRKDEIENNLINLTAGIPGGFLLP